MAKKWSEVASNPEFVALPYDEKVAVRTEYYDNVVAPSVPDNLRQVERMKFEDYAVIEAPEQGYGAAFGASVDRMQAGAQTLMGDHEAAAANIAEAQKYQPTIGSYKDVTDIGSAVEYAGELLAGTVPYMAAPVAIAGAATLGAPATALAGVSLATTAVLGALEGGATYAEQEEKNAATATVVGIGSALLERLPGLQGKTAPLFKMLENSPLLKNVVTKAVEGTIEETATTVGQTVLSGTVGHGQSFDQTIQNIDEQLMAGFTSRGTLAAPRIGTQTHRQVNTEPFDRENPTRAVNQDVDSAELTQVLTDPARSVESVATEVDRLWVGRDMDNTAEAAQMLQDRGAELSPVALDITTTRRERDPVTGEPRTVDVNIGREMGIGTGADRVSRVMASNFKIPFFGSLVDPKQGYDTTNNAYKGLKQDFDSQIGETLKSMNLPPQVRKDVSRDIQHYVMGRKKNLEQSSKTILANLNDMSVFDSISQTKRMRQMVENMKPKGAGGTIGGALGLGAESVITGGLPVLSGTVGTIGSAIAAGLNKVQKNKMKSIIEGRGTPESKLEALFKALDSADFSKSGIAEGLEEEIVEKTKPDMGTLEVVK